MDYLEQPTWSLMGNLCFVPTILFSFFSPSLCAVEKMQLRSLLDKTSVQPLRKFVAVVLVGGRRKNLFASVLCVSDACVSDACPAFPAHQSVTVGLSGVKATARRKQPVTLLYKRMIQMTGHTVIVSETIIGLRLNRQSHSSSPFANI